MLDAAVSAFAFLRSVVGRPQTHLGLTPLAIYAPLLGIAEIEASIGTPGGEIQPG